MKRGLIKNVFPTTLFLHVSLSLFSLSQSPIVMKLREKINKTISKNNMFFKLNKKQHQILIIFLSDVKLKTRNNKFVKKTFVFQLCCRKTSHFQESDNFKFQNFFFTTSKPQNFQFMFD